MELDLRGYLKRYHEICESSWGRDYDFSAIEREFAPLREGPGWLTPQHVLLIFDSDHTPFGRYWPTPNSDDLAKLSAARLSLIFKSQDREALVRRLLGIFHNTGVTSLILRCVHPEHFGVFSTPVLNLLQVNRGSTVELYLAYCDELSAWKLNFQLSSVAETEMAITGLAEIIKGAGTDKEAEDARRSFDGDAWVQRQRAEQVIHPFLRRRCGSLELAKIIVDGNAQLAALIAGVEYERLLGEASWRFRGRKLERGGGIDLLNELAYGPERKISGTDRVALDKIYKTRNAVVHGDDPSPTTEEVKDMIDRIDEICTPWDRSPKN